MGVQRCTSGAAQDVMKVYTRPTAQEGVCTDDEEGGTRTDLHAHAYSRLYTVHVRVWWILHRTRALLAAVFFAAQPVAPVHDIPAPFSSGIFRSKYAADEWWVRKFGRLSQCQKLP